MSPNHYLLADPMWLATHPNELLDTGFSAWNLEYRREHFASIGPAWLFNDTNHPRLDQDDLDNTNLPRDEKRDPQTLDKLNTRRGQLEGEHARLLAVIDTWIDEADQRGDDLQFVRADHDWTEIETLMAAINEYLSLWGEETYPEHQWGEGLLDEPYLALPDDPTWLHWFKTGLHTNTFTEYLGFCRDRFLADGMALEDTSTKPWQGWPTHGSYESRYVDTPIPLDVEPGDLLAGGWDFSSVDPADYGWPTDPTQAELQAIREDLLVARDEMVKVIDHWVSQPHFAELSLKDWFMVSDSNGLFHQWAGAWWPITRLLHKIQVFTGSYATQAITMSPWYDYQAIADHDPSATTTTQ